MLIYIIILLAQFLLVKPSHLYYEIKWDHIPDFSDIYSIKLKFDDENNNNIEHYKLSESNLDSESQSSNEQRFKFETYKLFDLNIIEMSIYVDRNNFLPCNNCDWKIIKINTYLDSNIRFSPFIPSTPISLSIGTSLVSKLYRTNITFIQTSTSYQSTTTSIKLIENTYCIFNCSNRGICDKSTLRCKCNQGYKGDFCADVIEKIKLCPDKPCINGGLCVSNLTNTTDEACLCPLNKYEGKYCEQSSQEIKCSKINCLNGGVCSWSSNEAKCVCTTSFEGEFCEKTVQLIVIKKATSFSMGVLSILIIILYLLFIISLDFTSYLFRD